MSAPPSNLNQDGPSGADSVEKGESLSERETSRQTPTALDAVAMKNFTFDASAAEATRLKEQAHAVQTEPTSRKVLADGDEASHRFVDTVGPTSEQEQESPLRIVVKPDVRARQGMPSWLMSLLLHVLLILPLGFLGLASSHEKQEVRDWTPSAIPNEEIESLEDIEIDPLEEIVSEDEELSSEVADSGMADWDDLTVESLLANNSADLATISQGLDEIGLLLGEDGSGLASLGEGPGTAATASFFGTQVEGKRILYMLDNSGGMKKGKFETLVEELLKSVDALQPRQQFYVIFYSDTVYPLFYPRSATNFVRATKKNKDFLRAWLDTVELCLGNSIDEALAAANVIEPDVVFLLSDGKLFTTDAKERILLEGAGRNFPINTFGMGVKEGSTAAEELQLVADANRGTYRAIQVSPEARDAAKKKLRPYHRERPGTVWGLTVTK